MFILQGRSLSCQLLEKNGYPPNFKSRFSKVNAASGLEEHEALDQDSYENLQDASNGMYLYDNCLGHANNNLGNRIHNSNEVPKSSTSSESNSFTPKQLNQIAHLIQQHA